MLLTLRRGGTVPDMIVKHVPAKRSNHPIAKQNSDWMLAPEYFKQLVELYGPFDVDCCAAKDGSNKQPNCVEHWFADGKNCFDQTWDGKRVYCNPPWERELIDKLFTYVCLFLMSA